jgi:phosphomannomutase
MSRLRADPPAEFGREKVSSIVDLSRDADVGVGDVGVGDGRDENGRTGTPGRRLPPADVLIFRLSGARVVLRPSGTEPKTKCYIEIIEPLAGRSLAAARDAAARRLAPLRAALQAMLTAG